MSKIHRFDQFKHMDIFHKEIGYYLSVAEVLNISKASEALGIRQSGLSRALHRLEEDLAGCLERAEQAEVRQMIVVGYDLASSQKAVQLAEAIKEDAITTAKSLNLGELSYHH